MLKKLLLASTGLRVAAGALLWLLSLPLLRRLPRPSRVALAGIMSIRDAVEACRLTQLEGWELVAYAQHLVARKFTYSRLNPWDTPSRAFERGLGYCQQQALALKLIYDQLGITARPVFARRCRFPPQIVDGLPWDGGITAHTWLCVCIRDEERNVCPGSLLNTPGVTQFTVLSPVHTLH